MLAAVLLASCNGLFSEPRSLAALVNNQTSTTLRFAVELPDELHYTGGFARPDETNWAVLHLEGQPEGISLKDGCVAGDLVALDLDGGEVARHPGPLCLGDTWTIAEPAEDTND
jgi:hypothetical protein